jgi:hypothetical protein
MSGLKELGIGCLHQMWSEAELKFGYHQRVDITVHERYLPVVVTTSAIDGVYLMLARLRDYVLAVSVVLRDKRFNKLDCAKSDGDACFVLAHGMVAEQKFVKTFIL